MLKMPPKTGAILFLMAVLALVLITPPEVIKKPSVIGAAVTNVFIKLNLPPYFDFNLTDQAVNESSTLLYDINCSDDHDFDDHTIMYYDNASECEIHCLSGLINWTPSKADVGNHSINITCTDGIFNVSQTFNIAVLRMNSPPVLAAIGPQITIAGELFTLYIYATDIDEDNLTFNASTTLFSVSIVNNSGKGAIGVINFTPTIAQAGNFTINLSVSDGNLSDFEIISFTISRGAYCGDSSCGSEETCSNCAADCGDCPTTPTPSTQSGASGGETSEAESAAETYYKICREKWECSEWSACSIDGVKTRKCVDVNKCRSAKSSPPERGDCVYIPTCSDGIKNGNEEDTDCGGSCQPCRLEANCFDGIQNQNETGTDCGGPCGPCEIRKYAKTPFTELPVLFKQMKRNFPWALAALASILIATGIAGDRAYVKRISKKDFGAYMKNYRRYKVIRRMMLQFFISFLSIIMIISTHIYIFSTNIDDMKKYGWVTLALILIAPIIAATIIRHYEYYEYKKKKKGIILAQTHKKQIRQLIRLEDELLAGIEETVIGNTDALVQKRKFEGFSGFYNGLKPAHGILVELQGKRAERLKLLGKDSQTINKALGLINDATLIKYSKNYPEFRLICENLKLICNNKEIDSFGAEEILLEGIREVSQPHMMSVIKSDLSLISAYNKLVDIYKYYTETHSRLDSIEEQMADDERAFCKKGEAVIGNDGIINKIKTEPEMARLYNSMVDLHDHYKKKQELYRRMKRSDKEED